MIDKRVASAAEAVADVFDGAAIMFGGFGEAGSPIELIHALIDQGATNLTMISNNCGSGQVGLAALLKAGRVSKVICSFPRTANSTVFPELYRSGHTKLELVPQGTLAERIRAGGAGIPAFYTPSAVGTPLAEGKECREFGDRKYLLEHGIRADFSLIKGRVADTHGNILYNKTARNFNPLMAMAAKVTIVQVAEIVEPGKLDPESIVTPGIFVERVVGIANPAHESELVEQEHRTHDEAAGDRANARGDGAASGAGHSRRLLCEFGHWHSGAGRQVRARGPLDDLPHRKWPARHGPRAQARRRRSRAAQCGQTARDGAAGRRLLSSRGQLRRDPRRPPGSLRARRASGRAEWRSGQLVHGRARRHPRSRRRHGPGRGREVDLRHNPALHQGRRGETRARVHLSADGMRRREPHLHRSRRDRSYAGGISARRTEPRHRFQFRAGAHRCASASHPGTDRSRLT